MSRIYSISYDNFYTSKDVTTLDSIDHFILIHKELEKGGEFSEVFCCHSIDDYVGYSLINLGNGDIELKLIFIEDDCEEVKLITLVESNMYIKKNALIYNKP